MHVLLQKAHLAQVENGQVWILHLEVDGVQHAQLTFLESEDDSLLLKVGSSDLPVTCARCVTQTRRTYIYVYIYQLNPMYIHISLSLCKYNFQNLSN